MKRVTLQFIADCAEVHEKTVQNIVVELRQLDLSGLV